jgi:hypothetical protein
VEVKYGTVRHIKNYDRFLAYWLNGAFYRSSSFFDDPTLDWEELVMYASAARVLPALSSHASRSALFSTFPQEIFSVLVAANTLNSDRNDAALIQTHQLTIALNQAGVLPVALKGLANILTGIYPDRGSRFLADIDLLVPANQFSLAVGVLEKLGYSADPTHPVELSVGHSYPPLIRHHSLEVDLHRTLGLGICPEVLPATDLIENAIVHDLWGASIGIPNPTHLLIHHIMHSQLHDVYRERVAPGIRTLYDFHLLNRELGNSLDWHAVESAFERIGQYSTLALYLIEAKNRFGIEPQIAIRLTPGIRLRRSRRELLRACPSLRFVDPAYYWFATFQPRTRRLREILGQPGGIWYLGQKFFRSDFYARLRADFRSS